MTALQPIPQVKSSEVQLLPGTIQTLYQDNKNSPLYASPRLQVIHIKKLNTGAAGTNDPANDRYRIILSDGLAYMQAMLGIQCNELAATELIKANIILVLKKFTCSLVKDRRILIVLDIDVNSIAQCDAKVGNPTNVEEILGIKGTATSNVTHDSVPVKHEQTIQKQLNPYSNISSSATTTEKTSTIKGDYVSISSLSPYQNAWTIHARCIAKTDIKTWTNARGEGKLFSVTLLDDSGEIRLTGFNDSCTIFYPVFEVGKVFKISRGSVKLSKKQFSNVSNEYEIHLEKDSLVVPLSEKEMQGHSLPNLKFSFEKIQDLVSFQKDELVDIIGVVKEIGELSQITSKATQKQLVKRDIVLADSSSCSVRVTLWGKQAEEASHENGWAGEPVLAIKGSKVSDYNGRTLSVSSASLLHMNPDIKEAHELRGWYDTIGLTTVFQNLSSGGSLPSMGSDESGGKPSGRLEDRCLINDIKAENLGNSEKADYIDIVATITFIKSDGAISYPACPGTSDSGGGQCQKKVTEIGPNLYRCEKCARNYDAPFHRYIFSLNVSDFSGQTWLNAFNEAGLVIFNNQSAQDLVDIKDADLAAFQNIVKEACFQRYLFRVRVKNEIYQGESKSRASIISLSTLDYAKETKLMLNWLKANLSA